jgi:two-component system sensor histidine kinase YesM
MGRETSPFLYGKRQPGGGIFVRYFRSMTFYKRLQLSLLLLVLLPVAGSAIFTYFLIQHNINQSMEERNSAYLNLVSQEISKTLNMIDISSRYLAQDTATLSRMRNLKDTTAIRTYDEFESADEIKLSFQYFSEKNAINQIQFLFVNPKGLMVQSQKSGQELERLLTDLPIVQSRIQKNTFVVLQFLGASYRYPLQKDQSYSLYFSRVIQDPWDTEDLGVTYVTLSSSYFQNLFTQQHLGAMVLYDSDGQYVAGDVNIPYLRSESTTKSLRSENRMSDNGWKLIYETPKAPIAGDVKNVYLLAGVVVTVFLLLFGWLSFQIAKRLHRPIRKLELTANQVGEGNTDIRFPEHGQDEIARLGRTLNTMLEKIKELMEKNRQEQEQNRVHELQALASQIRPHFLLNTLNTIKISLSLSKDVFHSGKIHSLTRLLRNYLHTSENATLQQECKLLEDYVDIMKMRNQLDMTFHVTLSDEARALEMPKLLLQPFIENAIVHGFADRRKNANLSLNGELTEHWLRISIQDNGMGMSTDKLIEINDRLSANEEDQISSDKRVGIYNVVQRLKLTYGAEASVTLQPNEGGGILAQLNIPIRL